MPSSPRSLAPAFLLSMPQLTDPNFNRTVVLLCQHNDNGAFGLVVNRPLVTTGRVVVNLEPPVSTERELEVLALLAQGMPNKEIAAHLTISERTAKFHVSSIMGKLGAGNRTEAVSLAAQKGLITLHS